MKTTRQRSSNRRASKRLAAAALLTGIAITTPDALGSGAGVGGRTIDGGLDLASGDTCSTTAWSAVWTGSFARDGFTGAVQVDLTGDGCESAADGEGTVSAFVHTLESADGSTVEGIVSGSWRKTANAIVVTLDDPVYGGVVICPPPRSGFCTIAGTLTLEVAEVPVAADGSVVSATAWAGALS